MYKSVALAFACVAVFDIVSGGLLRLENEPHFVVTRDENFARNRRPSGAGGAARPNLAQLAEQLNLTEFVKYLEETKVGHIINHEGPYTVFAPTNEAFARIPAWAKNVAIPDLIKFHVARGDYVEKELKDNQLIRSMLSKRDVRINFYKGANGKKIVTANGRTLNQTDFDAHNGVLHIVDDVMAAIYERDGTAFEALKQLPVKAETLERALSGVGLDQVLKGKGPFTVFVPSDEAFSKLPDDVVQYLLKNETAMKEVLLHHVVSGVWYSAGLVDEMTLPAADGKSLPVKVAGDVTIDVGKVTLADYTVSNGVLHVIDTVLVPKGISPGQ